MGASASGCKIGRKWQLTYLAPSPGNLRRGHDRPPRLARAASQSAAGRVLSGHPWRTARRSPFPSPCVRLQSYRGWRPQPGPAASVPTRPKSLRHASPACLDSPLYPHRFLVCAKTPTCLRRCLHPRHAVVSRRLCDACFSARLSHAQVLRSTCVLSMPARGALFDPASEHAAPSSAAHVIGVPRERNQLPGDFPGRGKAPAAVVAFCV
jgi:hypothetical protein